MDINKEKCKRLKAMRGKMADILGIELHQTECTYEGKCTGTCPKCKQEEDILNKAILKKGAVAIAATGMAVGLSGCSIQDIRVSGDNSPGIVPMPQQASEAQSEEGFELSGDVAFIPEKENPEACTETLNVSGEGLPEHIQETNSNNTDGVSQ